MHAWGGSFLYRQKQKKTPKAKTWERINTKIVEQKMCMISIFAPSIDPGFLFAAYIVGFNEFPLLSFA